MAGTRPGCASTTAETRTEQPKSPSGEGQAARSFYYRTRLLRFVLLRTRVCAFNRGVAARVKCLKAAPADLLCFWRISR